MVTVDGIVYLTQVEVLDLVDPGGFVYRSERVVAAWLRRGLLTGVRLEWPRAGVFTTLVPLLSVLSPEGGLLFVPPARGRPEGAMTTPEARAEAVRRASRAYRARQGDLRTRFARIRSPRASRRSP